MTDEERRAEALAIAHEQREEAQREEARRPPIPLLGLQTAVGMLRGGD